MAKIFIVTRNFPKGDFIGGAELQASILAKYLGKSHSWDARYIALEGPEAGVEAADGFYVHTLIDKRTPLEKSFWVFRELLRRERPDLCYIRDFRYLFILAVLCWLVGARVVFNTTHEKNLYLWYGWQGVKGSLLHLLSFVTLFFIHVIANNSSHAEFLKKQYGIKTLCIPNSIEDHYTPGVEKARQVVWVANIKPRKRPELFLQLVRDFKNSDYGFIMIGHLQSAVERYRTMIEDAARENPRFQYLGGKPHQYVDEILAVSEIFVSTCEPEGFPNNIIQACLSRCAILSYDYDPDGIFKNHGIGIVPRTYDGLKQSLQELMKNSPRRRELGERSRSYALEYHSPQKNMGRFHAYFSEMVAKSHP